MIGGLSLDKGRTIRLLFLILILAISFYGGVSTLYVLEVKNRKNGAILFRERVEPGEGFVFRYTHSVEKAPVEGVFTIEERGKIRMVETRFPSHGAGLPLSPKRDTSRERWFVHEGGGSYDELTFLFSSLNDPVLRFRHREIGLAGRDGREGMLTFSVQEEYLGLYLLRKLLQMGREFLR